MPVAILRRAHRDRTRGIQEIDADLLAGLRATGLRLDVGEDDAGRRFTHPSGGGGNCFNVGGPDLIESGAIDIVQA